MRLYILHKCPFGHRAVIALREKGLEFELRLFERGKRPPELEAVGPRAKSPTLFDGDAHVYDSQVVLEYIHERFPDPPLLPTHPLHRAEVRMLIARYNDEIGPKYGALLTELAFREQPDEAKIAEAKCAWVEALSPWNDYFKGRTFAVGERLTLADITLYTFFPSLEMFGVELPPELSALRAWHDRMRARSSTTVPSPA